MEEAGRQAEGDGIAIEAIGHAGAGGIERALDAAFASGRLDAGGLEDQTATIGQLQGQLRAAHLRAHLETRPLLSAEQIARYDQLRGYTAAK